jgi:CheY-like chemotaxis protein
VLDEPEKSRACGAAAHFTKPVTREQLAQFLHRPTVQKSSLPLSPELSGQPPQPVVLLAEDNPANIQTIGDYLSERGFAMRYASNGQIAISMAREIGPDCILMDIQMPVMDGLTAIEHLRSDHQFQSVPIIALTALAMPGDREKCISAGATEYLSKPVSLKALAMLISQLLPEERRPQTSK